jgi:hypothetical protein
MLAELLLEPHDFTFFRRVSLHHCLACDSLTDLPRHLGELLAGAFARLAYARVQRPEDQTVGGEDEHTGEHELPTDAREQHHRDQQLGSVQYHHDDAHVDHSSRVLHVVQDARQQGTRTLARKEPHAEPLKMRKEVSAQIRLAGCPAALRC